MRLLNRTLLGGTIRNKTWRRESKGNTAICKWDYDDRSKIKIKKKREETKIKILGRKRCNIGDYIVNDSDDNQARWEKRPNGRWHSLSMKIRERRATVASRTQRGTTSGSATRRGRTRNAIGGGTRGGAPTRVWRGGTSTTATTAKRTRRRSWWRIRRTRRRGESKRSWRIRIGRSGE